MVNISKKDFSIGVEEQTDTTQSEEFLCVGRLGSGAFAPALIFLFLFASRQKEKEKHQGNKKNKMLVKQEKKSEI
jgi:hypothetical protein